MNTKNVNFGEEKLRINIVDKNSFIGKGGTVSILYEDISSLSVLNNPQKMTTLVFGIIFLGLGIYMAATLQASNATYLAIGCSAFIILMALLMPKEYLGVETRGGSQYRVKVPGAEILSIIDEIEKRRKSLKN